MYMFRGIKTITIQANLKVTCVAGGIGDCTAGPAPWQLDIHDIACAVAKLLFPRCFTAHLILGPDRGPASAIRFV